MNVAQSVAVASERSHSPAPPPSVMTIYCPFPLKSSACDVQGIDEQAVAWCLDYGLCEPDSVATRMGCAAGIAAALPYAPDSTIVVATMHFLWGSLIDDHWDRHPELGRLARHVGELHRVMYAAPAAPCPPDDRWVASLHDLRRRLETVLSDAEFASFRYEHTIWLSGQQWSTALQQRPTPPTIGEYLRMRWAKAGVGTLVPFTAASSGAHPLRSTHSGDPMVRAFTQAVMTACALLNDLASAAKELLASTATTNLLSVLARTDTGGAAALDPGAARQLYERVVVCAARLQQQLLSDPRSDVARYAAELPNWLSAGIEWAADTPRYRLPADGTERVGFAPPRLTVSATPTVWDPDDLTPPPYPDIAWMWEQLA